jgi:esterase/lipase superfamily enzyme
MRWLLIFITFSLVACSNRTAAPIVPNALSIGSNRTVFVGTTRVEEEDGTFGIGRSSQLSLLELDISIPPNRNAGTISDGQDRPDPKKDFAIAARNDFGSPASFQQRLRQQFARNPSAKREVTVFVHGYNNSFADAAFRIAQLSEDLDMKGTAVAYAWPSRGHPLGYEYDSDSSLFARDGLQELLETIHNSGTERIVVVAHSLGSRLLMESMRQIELSNPGWTSRHLSAVILFSPDLNADVFRSQTDAFQKLPQPFVIFTSQSDHFLRLSAKIRWEDERLGNLSDVTEFDDLPIDFVDVSAFTDGELGNHFVVGSSPTLISLLKSADQIDESFLAGRNSSTITLPGRRRILRNAAQIIVLTSENR